MRVLFIGDVFSTPGYTVARSYLNRVQDDFDFIIVNGENVAGGFGITRKHFDGLLDAGADVVTLGNHTFDAQGTPELVEAHLRGPPAHGLDGRQGHRQFDAHDTPVRGAGGNCRWQVVESPADPFPGPPRSPR